MVLVFILGLVTLNIFFIIIAGIKAYFFVIIYSLYKSMTYEGGFAAFEAHKTANSAGYEQFYEPEGYDANAAGYQTTEFHGS